ncbi:interleukin-2 receptor subunit alpha-like [Pseudopipra pipra]|uniref:interleukin-2 receptor subunit alpha-like n=1 Tax=Pseudopipra pipra TaxID=415032 RepID=UPI003139D5E7
MWTSPMELKCLLMWLLFGFIKGNKREGCPDPPRIEFADVTAEMYVPGTKMYYVCDSGYDRKSGHHPGIQCNSGQQGAFWDYSGFECIDKNTLLSTGPPAELHFKQKPESKAQSPAPQKQENFSEFDQKDFCGPPKTVPHASIRVKKPYYMGQVLHFKCQSGYDKRPPTSGTSMCENMNGNITWTPLDVRCTNNSNTWPPQNAEPGLAHPSLSSSVTLPVTAICFVLLVILAVFV